MPAAGTVAGLVTITTTSIPLLVPITPPVGIVTPPMVPVAAPIVPVLLALVPLAPTPGVPLAPISSTTPLVDVVAPINALSDPVAVVNAVAQLSPASSDLVSPLVTFHITQQFQDLLLSRLDNVLCGEASRSAADPSTCKGDDWRGGVWIKEFGYAANQGAQQAFAGYTSSIIGTMVGYDVPLSPQTRVGLALGYAASTIKAKAFDNRTDINTYQVAAYAGHEQGPWYINGNLSFGYNDYLENRNVSFPGLSCFAQADYGGQAYTAYATTGYHFPVQKFTITPLASLQYTHVNIDRYTESGGGDINLAVHSRNDNYLESGLGVKVARDFSYGSAVYVPDIHAKWLHDFENPTLMQTAAFAVPGSPSFTTPGLKTTDNTFNVGAGLEILSCGCSTRVWSVNAVYDYYWRSDNYSAHQGMLRLTGRF